MVLEFKHGILRPDILSYKFTTAFPSATGKSLPALNGKRGFHNQEGQGYSRTFNQ
jgi:hypothetical protein